MSDYPLSRRFQLLLLLALGLFSISLAALIVFRLSSTLSYQPVSSEALTGIPRQPGSGFNLDDRRTFSQQFVPVVPAISHLRIGAANFRQAPANALLLASIQHEGTTIGTATLPLSALPNDESVLLPLATRLSPGRKYSVAITTQGIAPDRSLTLFYEPEHDNEFDYALTLNIQSQGPKTYSGRLNFALVSLPTRFVLAHFLLRSPATYLAAAFFLAFILVSLIQPLRRRLFKLFASPLSFSSLPVPGRTLLYAAALCALFALLVTAPYYVPPLRSAGPIDLQRALVYRAVGRDALLHHGAIALWEPYLCGGMTLIGNTESANLDPFFPLVLLFGPDLGLRFSVTAALILGSLGAFLLARRYVTKSFWPALLTGVIFSFSSFQLLGFGHYFFAWLPAGFIPWALFFFLESLKKPRFFPLASLTIAAIFLGGSIHMTFYLLLAGSVLSVILSLLHRRLLPLACWAAICLLAVPVASIKLLPVAAVQAAVSSFARPPAFIPPLSWAYSMFLSRSALNTPEWTMPGTIETFHWLDFGGYIGWVPLLLALFALPLLKRRPLLLASSLTCLLLLSITFGLFPWDLLHQLPVLSEVLRNPQRARGVALLFIGLLSAAGLSRLSSRLRLSTRLTTLLECLIVLTIASDLITLHLPLFAEQFTALYPSTNRNQPFLRLTDTYSKNLPGYYAGYLQNQGTTDHCLAQFEPANQSAAGFGSSDPNRPTYRGEAYLTRGGPADTVTVTPNTVSVSFSTPTDDWLVINQNYLPGWRTEPPRLVRNFNGLPAARVSSADQQLTFHYQPKSFTVGRLITLFSLAISALALPFRRLIIKRP